MVVDTETPLTVGELGARRTTQMTNDRMLQRAIKQRWPIPEQYKKAVIDRQVKIAIDPDASHREATAAARVLIAAEQQNQVDEIADAKLPVSEQHVHFHAESTSTIKSIAASLLSAPE